jgi:hypothetical protein
MLINQICGDECGFVDYTGVKGNGILICVMLRMVLIVLAYLFMI